MNLRSLSIRGRRWLADRRIDAQINRVEDYLSTLSGVGGDHEDTKPVIFFNASTRIHRISLNAAFSVLASWGIRARRMSVRYLVCSRGLDQCVLGVISKGAAANPPCRRCMRLSRRLFPARFGLPLVGDPPSAELHDVLNDCSVDRMASFEWDELSLGQLCLPSVRWVLRRHTLIDDSYTRTLFKRFLLSAATIVDPLRRIYEREQPRALVIFNGVTYPEAVARAVAHQLEIPVVTHEVGLRPYSAFFSHEDATFRQVMFSDEFRLGAEENKRLDEYLSDRLRGRFSMAGVEFWPEMTDLPSWLRTKMSQYDHCVAVFSNVIFDTSQVHANTIFAGMFEWLDDILGKAETHPETLFVIRAHPDEDRSGKASRESVAQWAQRRQIDNYPNVVFFPPSEYVSSYDLIRMAKFTVVYNSSIGLEGTLLGRPVLAAGKSRYTQIPTVFYPDDPSDYERIFQTFLQGSDLPVPEKFIENARRFFYFEMFHASLDLSSFLGPYPESRYDVVFKPFDPAAALQNSSALATIVDGIVNQSPFYEGMP